MTRSFDTRLEELAREYRALRYTGADPRVLAGAHRRHWPAYLAAAAMLIAAVAIWQWRASAWPESLRGVAPGSPYAALETLEHGMRQGRQPNFDLSPQTRFRLPRAPARKTCLADPPRDDCGPPVS